MQEIWKTRSQHQEVSCILSDVTRLRHQVGCARNRLHSHRVPEAEIISLDTGLRVDGTPALTLWNLMIEVFHSVSDRTDGPKRESWRNPSAVVKSNMHNSIPIKHTHVVSTNIDHIPSNRKHSGSSVCCMSFFQDNEAVIKIIIKGRSPTCFTFELLWICCPTGLIWIPKFKSLHWHQTPTRKHVD